MHMDDLPLGGKVYKLNAGLRMSPVEVGDILTPMQIAVITFNQAFGMDNH